jgi:hypothetical protein
MHRQSRAAFCLGGALTWGLAPQTQRQAERWGAELYTEDVEYIDLSQRPFTIRTGEREVSDEWGTASCSHGSSLQQGQTPMHTRGHLS